MSPSSPTSLAVVRHADARAFLERAGRWLAAREAEHNLILGIAADLEFGDHPYEPPVYLATVEEAGEVAGCAWRTPPFKVGVTRMPLRAVPLLAADLARVYDGLDAVMGDEEVASALARAWASPRGLDVRPGMRQRIYALTEVVPPEDAPPGEMRRAAPGDRERVVAWWGAFEREAGVPAGRDPERAVERRMGAGDLWLWDDGGPVSLAGVGGRTPSGVRIGPVYTPPQARRRGYATALVAELSRRQLAEGRTVCFLYTDLSNPTSNAVYTRIGYRPVSDVRDFHFEPEEPGSAGAAPPP